MESGSQPITYWHYENQQWSLREGEIVSETAVDLTVNGELWLTLMCTPTQLEALAVGFLFNEGIIHSADEVAIVRACDNGCNVDVWLHHSVQKPRHWRRTSGCTGGTTSREEPLSALSDSAEIRFDAEQILRGMALLYQSQDLYQAARGIHSSALSDGESLLIQVEDIGRHNTLDKLAGLMLLGNLTPSRKMILTTGRISSEMLQKASRIGAQVLVSRTSPTALSVRLAERYGITLIGYARRNQFNLYTHPERIRIDQKLGEASLLSASERV